LRERERERALFFLTGERENPLIRCKGVCATHRLAMVVQEEETPAW
jgi:hypothetical protein